MRRSVRLAVGLAIVASAVLVAGVVALERSDRPPGGAGAPPVSTSATLPEAPGGTPPPEPVEGEGAPTTMPTDPATVADTVLLLGDSAMMSAAPALAAAFRAAGATTVVDGTQPGFGLAEAPWVDGQLAELVGRHRPDLVVTMFGGWDAGHVERNGAEGYRAEVRDAAAVLTSDGARLLWLPVLPGGRGEPTAVDTVFAELPALYPEAVSHPDVDDALRGPDGGFPRTVVDDDGDVAVLRGADGWHLCPEGAARVAARLLDVAARRGWAAPPATAWADGRWREDPRYQDPPGGCDPS